MLFRPQQGFDHGVASEITPRAAYERHRELLKGMAVGGMALAARAQSALPYPGKLASLNAARSSLAGTVTPKSAALPTIPKELLDVTDGVMAAGRPRMPMARTVVLHTPGHTLKPYLRVFMHHLNAGTHWVGAKVGMRWVPSVRTNANGP